MKRKLDDEIKIIFFDIDHTLFDHEAGHFITSSFIVMEKLQQKGVKIFLCTARPFRSMMWLGPFARFNFDGFIAVNGGLIAIEDKIIYKDILEPQTINKLVAYAEERKLALEIMTTKNAFFATLESDISKQFMAHWKETKPSFKPYENEEVTSALLFSKDDESSYLKTLDCYFHRFCDIGIDIYPHHLRKGKGIDIVLKTLNIAKANAMAFGDDISDISMFEHVKYGIAMGNAKEDCKKKAYFVTKSISRNGVTYALKHFKLI